MLFQILALNINGKNIKSSYKNYESAQTWNPNFKFTDKLQSVSDIQVCFEYIITKQETLTNYPAITIYINKTKKRITFKIKTQLYLEIVTPKTMKLHGSTETKTTKDKNTAFVPF